MSYAVKFVIEPRRAGEAMRRIAPRVERCLNVVGSGVVTVMIDALNEQDAYDILELALHVSKIKLQCPHCGQPTKWSCPECKKTRCEKLRCIFEHNEKEHEKERSK